MNLLFRFGAALLGTALTAQAAAYLEGAWRSGTITMHLQLDQSPAPSISTPLLDGSTSWNTTVAAALTEWNPRLARAQFASVSASTAGVSGGNGTNNVVFAPNIYGEAFEDRTLAITLNYRSSQNATRIVESDVIFNTAKTWNSYRGNLRSSATTSPGVDIRRVALHEFGHVLGLDHPDEAQPAQTVSAIMNSTAGNLDTLQPDDIAGAQVLYGTALTVLNITRDLLDQTVAVGGRAFFDVQLNGQPAPVATPIQKYFWFFRPTGGETEWLFTIDDASTLDFGAVQLSDAGHYSLVVANPDGTDSSREALLGVTPVSTSSATRLANLSTRGFAGKDSQAMIVGFVISGTAPKRILLRAVGPTLGQPPFNLAKVISNPSLTVFDENQQPIATNDDWGVGGNASAAEIVSVSDRVGAFALPNGSKDSVVLLTLAPGLYTAQVNGVGGAEGVAIVEAYDADEAGSGGSRLVNLSTRGFVGIGDNIMVGGFVINGSAPRTYLLRAVGDTLQSFGVSGTLDDPIVSVFQQTTHLRTLDDWDSPEQLQDSLRATMTQVGAFPLTDRQESVLRLTLAPGVYSIQVRGLHETSGAALLELYEVPE